MCADVLACGEADIQRGDQEGSDSDTVIVDGSGNSSKPIHATKRFVGTMNNHSSAEYMVLKQYFKELCDKYVMQEEIGAFFTPHIQCAFITKKKIRLSTLRNTLPRLHIITMSKKATWKHQIMYCTKSDTYRGGMRHSTDTIPEQIHLITPNEEYYWQLKLLDEVLQSPDDRTIMWIFEREGNTGKTQFCKYLAVMHDALIISGGAKDIKHGIVTYIDKMGRAPKIVMCNIPRTKEDFVSYAGLEEVKDGIFFSPKYESSMVVYNSPHLICFANFEPDYNALSLDRWNVQEIMGPCRDMLPSATLSIMRGNIKAAEEYLKDM